MDNLKNFYAVMLLFAFTCLGCSEEKTVVMTDSSPKLATLSFGALLKNWEQSRDVNKTSLEDLPECSNDEPFSVGIVLSQNEELILGSPGQPFFIALETNQVFTREDLQLELPPGNYTLDYFAVFNVEEELIWLAPNGGLLANFFEENLPLSINLGQGVKKYVEVSVLCFNDRQINPYGYVLLDTAPAAIEFCLFGNYCDETGRHYPAKFSVSVWNYANGTVTEVIHSDITNTLELDENGDYAATPVCLAMPNFPGEDEYYIEITLLSSDAYGDIEEEVIRSGVITDGDVKALFDGSTNVDYFHFRQGCDSEDTPNLF